MPEQERTQLDTTGRYWRVNRAEEAPHDVGWRYARVLLSTRRLVLADNDGKHTVGLSNVDHVERRGSDVHSDSEYLKILVGSDVYFVATKDLEAFERQLCGSILDGAVLRIDHGDPEENASQQPADGDADRAGSEEAAPIRDWQRARLSVDDGVATLQFEDGAFGRIDFDAVTDVERTERVVDGEQRIVLHAVHDEDGPSTKTSFAGSERLCSALQSMLHRGAERNFANVDLDEDEREVLVALYAGISSLDIPAFVDMDLDRVESIYDRLVEYELVQEVRCRREVALNPSGRNVASDAMNGD